MATLYAHIFTSWDEFCPTVDNMASDLCPMWWRSQTYLVIKGPLQWVEGEFLLQDASSPLFVPQFSKASLDVAGT